MRKLFSTYAHRFIQTLVRNPRRTIIAGFSLLFLGMIDFSDIQKVLILLPGTRVGTVDPADNVLICQQCHQSTDTTKNVSLFKEWSGSMMAHSARDPIFFAALAVANKYNNKNAIGEYCIRCHSPSGWLAGHSENFIGTDLTGTDFDGIQCDYCHRLVDPMNPDSTVPYMQFPVPGYGNGMHVIQKFTTPKRGSLDTPFSPHETKYDSFQKTSQMCGICHDVSNPTYAEDRLTQPPYEYAPLERTFSEWAMSSFAEQGDSGTCQACHMKKKSGYACILPDAPLRTNISSHDISGGNTFVPDILSDFWTGLDSSALQAGKQSAIATLQEAAGLDVHAFRLSDTVTARVKITNLTGHKLPTGYPDGRRMWINLIGMDNNGDTVFQSGRYDIDSAVIDNDSQLKTYESIHGLTLVRALEFGLPAGPSFHFGVNDTIFLDNRIPPKGFTNEKFLLRRAEPIGVSYADSQYWDVTSYILPVTVTEVTAKIYYQTISREYVEFLRDENVGNSYDWNAWGDKLYNSWQQRGKSLPVEMNSTTTTVADSTTSVDDDAKYSIPVAFTLLQNYPNPFNPSTNIEYRISNSGFVELKIYDVLGKEAATLISERKPAGSYSVKFDAINFSNGVYLYSLSVNGRTQTKKMLLIK